MAPSYGFLESKYPTRYESINELALLFTVALLCEWVPLDETEPLSTPAIFLPQVDGVWICRDPAG
jgi:hypothetical protein